MGITQGVLKLAAPLPKLERFDSYLFIGPHPDDIEIGAGASVAKLVAVGKKVSFLICTDGRYGGDFAPPEELIEIRRQEARKSAEKLGVKDVYFLNLCDGGFYSEEELLRGMAQMIGKVQPDAVFAPDPDVTSECHADHLNVGRAAKRMAYFAPYGNIMRNYDAEPAAVKALALYMTAKPTGFIKTSGYLKAQLEAIFDCHLSQFPKASTEGKSVRLYLKLRAAEYGIRCLCRSAEGFRMLGVTQMHCLPEAGK